jgi:hypothetical protein
MQAVMDLISQFRPLIPLKDKPLEGFIYTVAFGILWVLLYKLAGPLTSIFYKGYKSLTKAQKIEWDSRYAAFVYHF